MKYIFLDIDGVLNCGDTKERCCEFVGIDPHKVAHLKYIVDATGAQIVLTSTWKYEWHQIHKIMNDAMANYLDKALSDAGLVAIAKTDDDGFDRGAGIIEYLQQNPADAWVVLDDMIFPDFERLGICEHLVLTNFDDDGLTQELARQAIEILG